MNKTENNYSTLRTTVYNYVKNNISEFYGYCYVDNSIYYIDIEEGNKIHNCILDDYVEKINTNKFFSGFSEINNLSINLNRPFVIL